ncbi:hypothetical protein A1O1_00802 [Capronia coronata CBS 617.96]|uniref:Uncharacterized protein n=1 Tax=Capronia coronata CBS 617.96 TaxID=1182541 RepID=W9ZMF2_9EURO|nr:uncharacterized protein A1O1_00802 [Capronia coronata CBS 617.96]EXJ95679.1 hypothetical protein A1O1_00802 [Capronia coronata CBS 617.96]
MTTMPSPTSLEKRKQPDELLFRMFEIRVVMENTIATNSVFVPAIECPTMAKMFDVVKSKVPLIRRLSILGEKLYAPVFLLQEASHKVQALRKRKWITTNWEDKLGFNQLEVVLWRMDNAATGQNPLHRRRFRMYVAQKVQGPETFKWEVHPKDLGDVGEEDPKAIPLAASTDEWFPERKEVETENETMQRSKRKRPNKKDQDSGATVAQQDKDCEVTVEEETSTEAIDLDDVDDFEIDLDLNYDDEDGGSKTGKD